tara:strand:- start:209 stop:487 length:279 start_codon:yes stop_codon:yes gene_type:complete
LRSLVLLQGSGRTDFQGGDPRKSYDSIVNKLFHLPDDALVYPAHDYKGMLCSFWPVARNSDACEHGLFFKNTALAADYWSGFNHTLAILING